MTHPKDEEPAIGDADASSLSEKESAAVHVFEGSDGVTEHDLATLRQVPDRFPLAAWLVVIVEFAER
jgi:proton-dependent oligopeptide transporter, POT family